MFEEENLASKAELERKQQEVEKVALQLEEENFAGKEIENNNYERTIS